MISVRHKCTGLVWCQDDQQSNRHYVATSAFIGRTSTLRIALLFLTLYKFGNKFQRISKFGNLRFRNIYPSPSKYGRRTARRMGNRIEKVIEISLDESHQMIYSCSLQHLIFRAVAWWPQVSNNFFLLSIAISVFYEQFFPTFSCHQYFPSVFFCASDCNFSIWDSKFETLRLLLMHSL